jgi:hypothetical protein
LTMEWWRVGCVLALPWLAGTLWVRALWRGAAPAGIGPLALGYGGLLGLLAATLLLRAQAALGLPLDFIGPTVVLALLALAGGWRTWRWISPPLSAICLQSCKGGWEVRWRQILFVLLLVWLGWRLAVLAQEIWWRPL